MTFINFLWFLLITPFQFMLWIFCVAVIAWIFGVPVTLTAPGGSKAKYRWFRRIK